MPVLPTAPLYLELPAGSTFRSSLLQPQAQNRRAVGHVLITLVVDITSDVYDRWVFLQKGCDI